MSYSSARLYIICMLLSLYTVPSPLPKTEQIRNCWLGLLIGKETVIQKLEKFEEVVYTGIEYSDQRHQTKF